MPSLRDSRSTGHDLPRVAVAIATLPVAIECRRFATRMPSVSHWEITLLLRLDKYFFRRAGPGVGLKFEGWKKWQGRAETAPRPAAYEGLVAPEYELPVDSGIPWCCANYWIDRSPFFAECIPMARLAFCNVEQGRGPWCRIGSHAIALRLIGSCELSIGCLGFRLLSIASPQAIEFRCFATRSRDATACVGKSTEMFGFEYVPRIIFDSVVS